MGEHVDEYLEGIINRGESETDDENLKDVPLSKAECDNCGRVAERYIDCEGDKFCPECASAWEKGRHVKVDPSDVYKTLADLRQEMIEEVKVMTDPHRILDEYNSMFGKNLAPGDVVDFDD